MNPGETSGGLAGQSGDRPIEGSDSMDAESVGGPDGAGSNLPSSNSSRTSATSLDPSTAPGTSALKALVGQAGIVAVERKLRKDLARIYSAADRLLPQGQRLYRRDQKGEITSIDCDIRRSNEIAEALKEKGTEIAPPVSLLLPLVSLITWAPIYLHSSTLATQRYLLPLSSLERSDIVDLVDADLLTEKASPSSTPLHLFFLPNSTDPFSSFTADPSHPQVSPWYTPSTSVPSSELSTPNFDPFTSLALPDSSRSTSRTISSRSRRSKGTTSSKTRTEKAAQVPRTTRNLTPDPSTTNNRTKSKKRSRGREEEGSEDEESVRKVRNVACPEACLAARELEKLEWEQERKTLKQSQENSKEKLKQTEEELRLEKARRQTAEDGLVFANRNLTVLGAQFNVLEAENSQLRARLETPSPLPNRPSNSRSSSRAVTPPTTTPERTASARRRFPTPNPITVNSRRKTSLQSSPEPSEIPPLPSMERPSSSQSSPFLSSPIDLPETESSPLHDTPSRARSQAAHSTAPSHSTSTNNANELPKPASTASDPRLSGYSQIVREKGIRGFIEEGLENKADTPILADWQSLVDTFDRGNAGPLFLVARKDEKGKDTLRLTSVLVDGNPNYAFLAQCSDDPKRRNVIDLIAATLNKNADYIVSWHYTSSEGAMNDQFASTLYLEWASKRLNNPNASVWHHIIAKDQSSTMCPIFIGANRYLHNKLHELREEERKTKPWLPRYEPGKDFHTFDIVDKTGDLQTKEHPKDIVFTFIDRRAIGHIGGSPNGSVTGYGLMKIRGQTARTENTETVSFTAYPFDCLPAQTIVNSLHNLLVVKEQAGNLLPHSTETWKRQEVDPVVKKLRRDGLYHSSKVSNTTSTQRHLDLKARQLSASSSASSLLPLPSVDVTRNESYSHVSFGDRIRSTSAKTPLQLDLEALKEMLLPTMNEYGSLICTCCLSVEYQHYTGRKDSCEFTHPSSAGTQEKCRYKKIRVGGSAIWMKNLSADSEEVICVLEGLETYKTTQVYKGELYTSYQWPLHWYKTSYESTLSGDQLLGSIRRYLQARPTVDPFLEVLMKQPQHLANMLRSVLGPSIYVSIVKGSLTITGASVKANLTTELACFTATRKVLPGTQNVGGKASN